MSPMIRSSGVSSLDAEVDWTLVWGEASPDPLAQCTVFHVSGDPNDMIGPAGPTADHWVTGKVSPYSYTARFQNKPKASGSAYHVTITDKLDARALNLSTLQLGAAGFGTKLVTPPAGAQHWTGTVDLPAQDELVRINANFDRSTGVLQWQFTTLDASTGRPITDPSRGFLPPDKHPPEGEGSVNFTVLPRAGLPTGDRITNRARIVFDTNAAIDTPIWVNAIDHSPPTSYVTSVKPSHRTRKKNAYGQTLARRATALRVRWKGSDQGSGIAGFDVYIAVGHSPFKLWLLQTPTHQGTYRCRPGTTYRFYTVAFDAATNKQTKPAKPSAPARCP